MPPASLVQPQLKVPGSAATASSSAHRGTTEHSGPQHWGLKLSKYEHSGNGLVNEVFRQQARRPPWGENFDSPFRAWRLKAYPLPLLLLSVHQCLWLWFLSHWLLLNNAVYTGLSYLLWVDVGCALT